jgi:hypothetical protein
MVAACTIDDDVELGTTTAAVGAAIIPPSTAMERPKRVFVLPVVWFPADQWSQDTSADYAAAKQNLGIHLRVAREKYKNMIANPITGVDRGTFELADWNNLEGFAREFDSELGYPEPLRVYSSKFYVNLVNGTTGVAPEIVDDVLTAAGCHVQSCPFVFVIMVADPAATPIDAIAFNYGFNGGGGFVRLPMSVAARSHLTMGAPGDLAITLQSVLLHELGHAFGLRHMDTYNPPPPHVAVSHLPPESCYVDLPPEAGGINFGAIDAYDDTTNCTADQINEFCNDMGWDAGHYAFHCSYSVMSYYKLNGTRGCLANDAAGLCAMPNPLSLVNAFVPGELVAENLHNLALNELVFPDLAKDFDVLVDDDDGNNAVLWHDGNGAPDVLAQTIPGHPRLKVTSPHNDFFSAPRAGFGYHSKPIEPSHTSFNALRNFHSTFVGAGNWAHIDFNFPEDVSLGRVRVYTGYNNGVHKATDLEVLKGIGGTLASCGTAPLGNRFDGETDVAFLGGACGGGKPTYRIRFKAGPSGYVVVRGIRLFDLLDEELQAPRMPIATSTYTAYGSSPQNVVGWDQWINAYYHPYNSSQMWHSKSVGPNRWASIDIRLPNYTTITGLGFYTGYGSGSHPATRVQIEYRNSAGVYVAAHNVGVGPYSFVNLPAPIFATHLRIAFKAGPSGHVVVRGIRMFNGSNELYTPTYEYENMWPLY